MLLKITLGLIIFVILRHYQNEKENRKLDKYDLIQKYLLNEWSDEKPILWIHNNYQINARKWESFSSRNSKKLNQPYIKLCIQSIIKHCGNSFNIVLISDSSFQKLIPNWNFFLNIISNPILKHMRNFGLSNLLFYYGGMLIPSSTIVMEDLKPLYIKGIKQHGCFSVEKINKNNTSQHKEFFPTMKIMGCTKKNPIIKEFVKYLETLTFADYTAETDFLGNEDRWLYKQIFMNRMTLIDGKYFGTKTISNKPMRVNDLFSDKYNDFDTRYLKAIYIPNEEILKKKHLQWFTHLSSKHVLKANILISKFLLLSLGNQNSGI